MQVHSQMRPWKAFSTLQTFSKVTKKKLIAPPELSIIYISRLNVALRFLDVARLQIFIIHMVLKFLKNGSYSYFLYS